VDPYPKHWRQHDTIVFQACKLAPQYQKAAPRMALESYEHDAAPPPENNTQSSYYTTVYLTVSALEPHKNDAAPHSVHRLTILLYNLESYTGAGL
jgi:hypothetical protein